jgi:lipoprotein-anchoring transpeptidase ErfK/SrfK
MRKLFVGFLLYALIIGMVSISGCSNLYLSRSKDASQQDNIDIQPALSPDDQQMANQAKATENYNDSIYVNGLNKSGANNSNTKYNKPFYIRVNLGAQIVTAYKYDQANDCYDYFKDMICSTGKVSGSTPVGVFAIYNRYNWLKLVGNVYGQYCVRFNGQILFHSMPYLSKNPSSLKWDEYNKIGMPASLGCVRLQVIDAKWIYDNCSNGTLVDVSNGIANDSLLKSLKPMQLAAGITWDPSDPNTNNNISVITKNETIPISDFQTQIPTPTYTSTQSPTQTYAPTQSPTQTYAPTQSPTQTYAPTQSPTQRPTLTQTPP